MEKNDNSKFEVVFFFSFWLSGQRSSTNKPKEKEWEEIEKNKKEMKRDLQSEN